MIKRDALHVQVESGDTLSAIAKTVGVPLSALIGANRMLPDPNHILPGDVLHIPAVTVKPALGFATFTAFDRAAWTTTHPQYKRLADSGFGNVDRVLGAFPVVIPEHQTAEAKRLQDGSIFVMAQAVLFDADGSAARRDRVFAWLDQFAALPLTWPVVNGKQSGNAALATGWVLSNIVDAAWIVGYPPSRLTRILTYCTRYMDWWGSPNWHALFAAVRLKIAGYLADLAMFVDAEAYLAYRMPQSLWVGSLDGPNVRGVARSNSDFADPATVWPGIKADVTADPVGTKGHWYGQTNGVDFTLINPADGAGGERTRDLSHESMGMKSWLDALLVLRANGRPVPPELHARLTAHVRYHGSRVLALLETGTIPAPVPTGADAGVFRRMGWWTAKRYLGVAAPAAVDELLARVEVRSIDAGGALHISCEAFAYGAAT